jgi:hypothetical protein
MSDAKNSGRLPAFQFYPADWRKDPGVQSLDYETRGIWWEIICLLHESDERGVLLLNGKPMPEDALCRLLGLDNQKLTTALTTLLTYGVAKRRESDGAIYSKRMVADENLRQIRKMAGSKGGNPLLVKQNTTTRVKQKPTPSSSSSSSSSSSIKEESPLVLPFESHEFAEVWHRWTKYRKEIKKPITPTMAESQLKNLAAMGEGRAIAMIENTISKGWQGLREEVEPQRGNAPRRAFDQSRMTEGLTAEQIGTL